jgi:ribonuclease P protein component
MGDFSFTKADRLLKRIEFIRLSQFDKKYGKKLSNKNFIVVACPGESKRSRLGITATKKVGCAAERNRIKRLSREYFRLNRKKIRPNCDINLIVKQTAKDLSSEQFFLSLKEIFDRI